LRFRSAANVAFDRHLFVVPGGLFDVADGELFGEDALKKSASRAIGSSIAKGCAHVRRKSFFNDRFADGFGELQETPAYWR